MQIGLPHEEKDGELRYWKMRIYTLSRERIQSLEENKILYDALIGEGINIIFPTPTNPNVEKYSTASVSLGSRPALTANQATCQATMTMELYKMVVATSLLLCIQQKILLPVVISIEECSSYD
ncbi:hypothetical protein SADUNF_Sadunf06G0046400 [Salix dunnii]|uniref:Uncharacterized protein n=1 Tax=Salix dunnii TaxID=1413687 RepID=A0A835MWB8_9ROSI|nr:hypothetical protein SADUNF_Sadunf06G0046400 [Salix dunnii]